MNTWRWARCISWKPSIIIYNKEKLLEYVNILEITICYLRNIILFDFNTKEFNIRALSNYYNTFYKKPVSIDTLWKYCTFVYIRRNALQFVKVMRYYGRLGSSSGKIFVRMLIFQWVFPCMNFLSLDLSFSKSNFSSNQNVHLIKTKVNMHIL